MLTGRNIHKSFGSVEVLRGIDLTIAPGTITAVLGPSGSGKTTLLKALALLEPPDKGEVKIDENVYEFPATWSEPEPSPWPKVTVVFQDLFLWPHLSNRQNILLPARLRPGNNADGDLPQLIDQLRLAEFIDRHPNQVSRGQRQVIAIARAIALKPKYLLLDEITSSLDLERAGALTEVLRSLAAEGVGILVITHQLGFAKNVARRVAFLDTGTIIEEGDSSIVESPNSERLRSFIGLIKKAV